MAALAELSVPLDIMRLTATCPNWPYMLAVASVEKLRTGGCLSVTCTSVIGILVCRLQMTTQLTRAGRHPPWDKESGSVFSHQHKLLFARQHLNTEAERRVLPPWTYPLTALGQTSSELACKFLSKWSPQTAMNGIPAKMCHLLACFTFWATSVYTTVEIWISDWVSI